MDQVGQVVKDINMAENIVKRFISQGHSVVGKTQVASVVAASAAAEALEVSAAAVAVQVVEVVLVEVGNETTDQHAFIIKV